MENFIKQNEFMDYSKKENWIINESEKTDKAYDLIYIPGTGIWEPTYENGIGTNFDQMRASGYHNYKMCGEQLSQDARVFIPVQRQLALKYAIVNFDTYEKGIKELSSKESYTDLACALDYYFQHYNKDAKRPFVLAGHSQGGSLVLIALEKYFMKTDKKDYLKNMIAAYCLGAGVERTKFLEMTNNEEIIHFAKSSDDYNCVISWNTEGDGDKGYNFLMPKEEYGTLVINPLNWKRDETYASIKENLGVLLTIEDPNTKKCKYEISNNPKDLFDAQLDLKRGSVICTTNKDFVNFPQAGGYLWGGKSLHVYDGKGFYNNMKQNIKVRVNNFLKNHK